MYSVLLAVLFACSLLCYLLCKDKSTYQPAAETVPSNKTTSASVIQTVETNREDELGECKPKYKKMNLQIEIPQSPRGVHASEAITWEMVKVVTMQTECLPLTLCTVSKHLQRYQRLLIFSGQLLVDCFFLSLFVWMEWKTRGVSKYFTAGLIATAISSPSSAVFTLVFLHCSSKKRPQKSLVLFLVFLLGPVSVSLYFLSDFSTEQSELWLCNLSVISAMEVIILEPFKTLLKIAVGLSAKENKCWEAMWPA